MRVALLTFAALTSLLSVPTRGEPGSAGQVNEASKLAADQAVQTQHRITVGGKALKYTAMTGTLTIRDDKGQPRASMFYVAYVLNPNDHSRPITFLYNGGPGSSSVWIHLGSFGPKRTELPGPGETAANPPYRLIDNQQTLLPKSDLVFLDAINTGYSRPAPGVAARDFMTSDADAEAFAKGIERFVTAHDRWNSPKFLFGESYGTARNAVLVDRLQRDGVQMNGVIALGSILDVSRVINHGDRLFVSIVPSYAVTAAYHRRIAQPGDEQSLIASVIQWAEGPYAQALAKGAALSDDDREVIARQLARYSGLSEQFILQNDLRVDPDQFRAELLRDQGLAVGELDTRYTAAEAPATRDAPSFDPSGNGTFRIIVSQMNDYIHGDLGFSTDLEYRRSDPETARSFDFRRTGSSSFTSPFGTYGDDLAHAMTANPRLKVLTLNGLFDLSTIFYGAVYDYRHLRIPRALAGNISYKYYDGGHMAYSDDSVRREMYADIMRFYDEAAPVR